MRRFGSLGVRMVLSHILVAYLTTLIVWGVILLIITLFPATITARDYAGFALVEAGWWVADAPDGLPNDGVIGLPPGFALTVAPDNKVLHSFGSTGCRAGKMLADCAPELLTSALGERFLTLNSEQWAEVVLPLKTGERVIARFGTSKAELALYLPPFGFLTGNVPFVAVVALWTAILSVPVALFLGWLLVRPIARRVLKIARASQQFAAGNLATRVLDTRQDEVGEMARQFDEMANTLEQNVLVLREMAERNTALTQKAEQAAIQAERLRLSRDLHDDIAQRMFSLSVNASTLPATIERDPAQARAQAQAVATLAEQTLLQLRTLLVELRPSQVVQLGLAGALQTLCNEWRATNQISLEYAPILTGQHIPAGVEEALYRVTQESLHNIAKHAQATSVQVSLVEGRRQITLSVTDDGRGFDPAQATAANRFGLISMQERARALGGMLAVESDTNKGTTIRLSLPLGRNENL